MRPWSREIEYLDLVEQQHHAGGIAALRRASGATVAASPPSALVLERGESGRDDPQFGSLPPIEPVSDVQVIADGDTLGVGPLALTARFTPGHTPGGTSWVLAVVPGWAVPGAGFTPMLDEFQNLGRLGPVERDMSLARGFGVQFWLFVQDIARLRATYPHAWETFITNSDILQAFGASNDRTTSEYLSWLTGEATIFVESDHESLGVSHGKLHNTQRGTGQAVSERGRRLLTPDEVRRLGRDLQVVFLKGHNPIVTRRLNYPTDPLFRGRFDPNP